MEKDVIMYLEAFLPYLKPSFLFNAEIEEDEEMCASLTAAICPEIITLLHTTRTSNVMLSTTLNLTTLENDEHADGLL